MRAISALSFAAASLSLFATSVSANSQLLANILCTENQFWYPALSVCLPNGGPAGGVSSSKKCPKNWYYLAEKKACAPTYPDSPLPICAQGHWWDPKRIICKIRCDGPLEFWFAERGQCVQNFAGGAVSTTPTTTTPTDHTCAKNWHWDVSLRTCIPNQDDAQNDPTCEDGFIWTRATLSCQPVSPITPPPTPSQDINRKRNAAAALKKHGNECPDKMSRCLIPGTPDQFECIDTQNTASSCGGCLSHGEGRNCDKITLGIRRSQCERGGCKALKCAPGYKFNKAHNGCIRR